MKIFPKNHGYSLVEMMIYAGILSLIVSIVVSMLLSFGFSYKNVSMLRLAENSGIYSIERMTRDIVSASTIDVGNSTFGSNPGVLSIVSTGDGVSTTTKFYVQNGVLKVDVNGSYFGPLTSSDTTVTNLVFRNITTSVSSAIKIDFSVRATSGAVTKDKNYYTTVILRGNN